MILAPMKQVLIVGFGWIVVSISLWRIISYPLVLLVISVIMVELLGVSTKESWILDQYESNEAWHFR